MGKELPTVCCVCSALNRLKGCILWEDNKHAFSHSSFFINQPGICQYMHDWTSYMVPIFKACVFMSFGFAFTTKENHVFKIQINFLASIGPAVIFYKELCHEYNTSPHEHTNLFNHRCVSCSKGNTKNSRDCLHKHNMALYDGKLLKVQ